LAIVAAVVIGLAIAGWAFSSRSSGGGSTAQSRVNLHQKAAVDQIMAINQRDGTPTDRACLERVLSTVSNTMADEIAVRGLDAAIDSYHLPVEVCWGE
jgi:hypothetical protein